MKFHHKFQTNRLKLLEKDADSHIYVMKVWNNWKWDIADMTRKVKALQISKFKRFQPFLS